jgi:hypothetical protein
MSETPVVPNISVEAFSGFGEPMPGDMEHLPDLTPEPDPEPEVDPEAK